jgi:hypothetical protein
VEVLQPLESPALFISISSSTFIITTSFPSCDKAGHVSLDGPGTSFTNICCCLVHSLLSLRKVLLFCICYLCIVCNDSFICMMRMCDTVLTTVTLCLCCQIWVSLAHVKSRKYFFSSVLYFWFLHTE